MMRFVMVCGRIYKANFNIRTAPPDENKINENKEADKISAINKRDSKKKKTQNSALDQTSCMFPAQFNRHTLIIYLHTKGRISFNTF